MQFVRGHSATPEDIDAFLGTDPFRKLRDDGVYHAFEKPLLLLDGQYYLLHLRGLENALGPAVFYAALPPGAQQRYFAFVGRFFEGYMAELLQHIAHVGGYSYSAEIPYRRSSTRKSVKSTDHFLYRDGALFFIEDRFARMSRAVLTSLDTNEIEAAFRNILFAKFEQLNINIISYLSGDFDVPGVLRSNVHAIYPLIALPHAFPRSSAVQARIDAEIAGRYYLQGKHSAIFVKPYEIVEAESIEGLAGLDAPINLSDILERKFASAQSRPNFFKNHLVMREGLKLRIAADFDMTDWYRELEAARLTRLAAEFKSLQRHESK